ncbi:hypothetical protein MMC17_002326 [Xylographa soralifera]|nr:hypothetical protein [Xylographa soralifera]
MASTDTTPTAAVATRTTSSLDSSFPVELPYDPALVLPEADFNNYIHKLLSDKSATAKSTGNEDAWADLEIKSLISNDSDLGSDDAAVPLKSSEFMDSLLNATATPLNAHAANEHFAHNTHLIAQNKMFTENDGIAYTSTTSPLLDLFSELEKAITGPRLWELLGPAWKEDSLATLKIVWNARSIHLGKAEQESFYRCLGWIKEEHPETVVANLPWLFRPVVEKKVKKEDEEAAEMVEREELTDNDFDVVNGVSHGYWKDLLNILVLAVNKSLDVLNHPQLILKDKSNRRNPTVPKSKSEKHKREKQRHNNALEMLQDPFYKALHLSVARLFAQQLKKDLELLQTGSSKDRSQISLAAKWAPSLEGFHDKHTFIATSIAEILYPHDTTTIAGNDTSREMYLKFAREHYRRHILSPLRKALEVVERDVSAETFHRIDFAKVPSIAMNTYKELFVKKSPQSFETYIDKVAEGKSHISGATLSPAKVIQQVYGIYIGVDQERSSKLLLKAKTSILMSKVLDAQWATLVKRIKDSGTLANSIAVCDVSGSMTQPTFKDGTEPLHTAIGLSLLLAEVVEGPFGGVFITFSSNPQVVPVGGQNDKRSLLEKVRCMHGAEWQMNTDFTAVFERLILPMAIKHKVKQEDMIKQIFVFSDMQFDQVNDPTAPLETAYERIKRKYADAGYEVPQLIFWNLNGHPAESNPKTVRDNLDAKSSPKPVTSGTEGTMLVSGYSQGLLKMFLENGHFEEDMVDEEVEVEDVEEEGEEDAEGLVQVKTKKRKMDPMAGLRKAIEHKAYSMLNVVD